MFSIEYCSHRSKAWKCKVSTRQRSKIDIHWQRRTIGSSSNHQQGTSSNGRVQQKAWWRNCHVWKWMSYWFGFFNNSRRIRFIRNVVVPNFIRVTIQIYNWTSSYPDLSPWQIQPTQVHFHHRSSSTTSHILW